MGKWRKAQFSICTVREIQFSSRKEKEKGPILSLLHGEGNPSPIEVVIRINSRSKVQME